MFRRSSNPSVRIQDFKILCNALAFPRNSAERSPPSSGHAADWSALPRTHLARTERYSLILYVGIVSRFLAFPIIFCGSISAGKCTARVAFAPPKISPTTPAGQWVLQYQIIGAIGATARWWIDAARPVGTFIQMNRSLHEVPRLKMQSREAGRSAGIGSPC